MANKWWLELYFSGRQPYRSGMYGPVRVVIPPHSIGLSHDELTVAEALRDFAGYTTGIVGKWHLGEFLCISFTVFILHLS